MGGEEEDRCVWRVGRRRKREGGERWRDG